MAAGKAYDVFLSHNKQDKPRVRAMAEALRQAGLTVWFDEWAIQPGDDIVRELEQGLASSKTLLLFLSPASVQSGWVEMERNTVVFRNPANKERQLIPILLEDCDIPLSVERFRYHDLREGTARPLNELLTALGKQPVEPQDMAPSEAPLTTSGEVRTAGDSSFEAMLAAALSHWDGAANLNINPLEVFPHMNWNLSDRAVGQFDGCMLDRKQIMYRAHKSIVMSEEIRRLHQKADGAAIMYTARPDGIKRLWMLHKLAHDRFVGTVASNPGGLTQLQMTKRDDPFQSMQHQMNEQSRSTIQQTNARTPLSPNELVPLKLRFTSSSPDAILLAQGLPEVQIAHVRMLTTDRRWSSRFSRARLYVEMEYTLNGTTHRGYARQVFGLGLLLFQESKEWPDYNTDGLWYARGLEFPNSPEPDEVSDWRLRIAIHDLDLQPTEELEVGLRTNASLSDETDFVGLS